MACNTYTLKGLARGCKDSIGGIKKVYLANDLDSLAPAVDDSTHLLSLTQTEVALFKPYNFFKNTGSMTTTLQTSENAGNSWQTEVALVFMKMETAKRLEIEAMVMQETVAIVEDMNGKMWYLGKDNGITASAATIQSGTAGTDLNGYNVTLQDESKDAPFELDAATAALVRALTVA